MREGDHAFAELQLKLREIDLGSPQLREIELGSLLIPFTARKSLRYLFTVIIGLVWVTEERT